MTRATAVVSQPPVVFTRGGLVLTSSLVVADLFHRDHKNVLSRIDDLIEKSEALGNRLEFKPIEYVDQRGRSQRAFEMDREAFSVLVMGFSGEKAIKFKIDYTRAFKLMEGALASRTTPPQPLSIDVRDPSQLAQIALQLIGVNEELKAKIAVVEETIAISKPKAEFYDSFANADGLYGLQNAARILDERPNIFIRRLKETHLFYQGAALVPRQQFVRQGLFEVKATRDGDRATYQTFVTPKGLQHFARELGKSADLFGKLR